MNKKQLYVYFILTGVIISTILIFTLYVVYASAINESLNNVDGARNVAIIITIRIILLIGMTIYMFHEFFSQEEQYLSDIPFLFGIFFLILIFGKLLDLLYNLIFYTINEESVLILIKIRFFVAIATLFSMMYLSIGMILYYLSLKEKFKKFKNTDFRKMITLEILLVVVIIEVIAVILTPNTTILGLLLPCFVLPSLATIVWLFYFAYKNQRLSQVHPLIIAIGFGAFLVSQLLRPLAQNIIGENASYIILVETIDIFIFFIIFIGLILKVDYNN
ncbi:MAG: hypothetical protein ACTSPD_12175 [Promethearchaeota archaeon]